MTPLLLDEDFIAGVLFILYLALTGAFIAFPIYVNDKYSYRSNCSIKNQNRMNLLAGLIPTTLGLLTIYMVLTADSYRIAEIGLLLSIVVHGAITGVSYLVSSEHRRNLKDYVHNTDNIKDDDSEGVGYFTTSLNFHHMYTKFFRLAWLDVIFYVVLLIGYEIYVYNQLALMN